MVSIIVLQNNIETSDPQKRVTASMIKDSKDFLIQQSIHLQFEYKERLVCISTGTLAPTTANTDRAIEIGE